MQKHIFEDLAWQHQAYIEGGLTALEYAHASGSALPIGAWRNIRPPAMRRGVRAGNRALLRREQEEVLRDDYPLHPRHPRLPMPFRR